MQPTYLGSLSQVRITVRFINAEWILVAAASINKWSSRLQVSTIDLCIVVESETCVFDLSHLQPYPMNGVTLILNPSGSLSTGSILDWDRK